MEIMNKRETLDVRNADLAKSRFDDFNLQGSSFTNVNLGGTHFVDVNLSGTHFADVNLAGATIQNANLAGMVINGLLVTDLLRAFRSRPQIVLYAKHLATLLAFYQAVFLLKVDHAEPGHVVLAGSGSQLVIVQIPESIATTIAIAVPPVRRTETPLKLVLDVESLATARRIALGLGGGVDAVEREWVFQGCRVCDGHDPEGNVVQYREISCSSGK
jgi:predicted enzyme related to lactoylglutathione lyase